ncbi:glycosyltransferase [Mesorhizobium sp.]|uniref:CgeB family protein n=1 Tax=Mesorhizobium sp. TaxID=1871066 RepID=UPI00121E7FD4|nr:glycosyltransferase [Mesorhizobium sp.]TIL46154.1 MAG: glycosyltransferase family 1 protein [Mesorhizobium sp.]
MRLLAIGPMKFGSTTVDRLQALSDLGFEIVPFDVGLYRDFGMKLERSIAWRFNTGRAVKKMNEDLIEFSRKTSYDLVWVDKGVWLHLETLDYIKKRAQLKVAIHYTPDAQFLSNRSRHFIDCIPTYDLMVTTKPFEIELYKLAKARNVLLVLQGYGSRFGDADRFVTTQILSSDLCFVGHCQRHYAKRLKVVAALGFDLKVWGPRWTRYQTLHPWARNVVQSDGLWGDEYAKALASAKIGIGLLSKYIPETTTTRTFEIPAVGTFMLAERTEDHLSLFEEGKEAEFFSSDAELREKIGYYVRNDAERAKVASAGRRRSLISGYSGHNQMAKIVGELRRLGLTLGANAALVL